MWQLGGSESPTIFARVYTAKWFNFADKNRPCNSLLSVLTFAIEPFAHVDFEPCSALFNFLLVVYKKFTFHQRDHYLS